MTSYRFATLLFIGALLSLSSACIEPSPGPRPCANDDDCLTAEGYECIDDLCLKPGETDAGVQRVWQCGVGSGVQGDGECDCGCGDDDPDCGEEYTQADCVGDWCFLRFGGDPVTNHALVTDLALCEGDTQ